MADIKIDVRNHRLFLPRLRERGTAEGGGGGGRLRDV
jgi:hypothetical protein